MCCDIDEHAHTKALNDPKMCWRMTAPGSDRASRQSRRSFIAFTSSAGLMQPKMYGCVALAYTTRTYYLGCDTIHWKMWNSSAGPTLLLLLPAGFGSLVLSVGATRKTKSSSVMSWSLWRTVTFCSYVQLIASTSALSLLDQRNHALFSWVSKHCK